MVTELLRERKRKRRRKKTQMPCLIICVCAPPWGPVNSGEIYKSVSLISFTQTQVALSFKKPQTPLPLGNLPVCHAEVFSSQIKLLQQTSKTAGLHILWRGQKKLIFLAANFMNTLSTLPPPLLSLYLFWTLGLKECILKVFKYSWKWPHFSVFFLGWRHFQDQFGF